MKGRLRLPDASGEMHDHWINVGYHPYRDANGVIQGILALVIDVTSLVVARRKAETTTAELALERHKLETIFEQAPAAMALWRGPDFIFEKVNPGYQAIFPDRHLQG